MRLLLTSAGVTNDAIRSALGTLIGQPTRSSHLLYVGTAMHGVPQGATHAWQALAAAAAEGWASVGLLELIALESLPEGHWLPCVAAADVLMVGGGNTPYLSYWLERSGFGARLPGLLERMVYVGASAGSLVAARGFNVDERRRVDDGIFDDDLYGDVAPRGFGAAVTYDLVDFAVRPHLHSPDFPGLTLERIRSTCDPTVPTFVIDDDCAVVVDGARREVVGDGAWALLGPPGQLHGPVGPST